ncbi:MAG: tetratricopeptide repeat protein, partial [Armatimonadia bacterium]|nr:tetratricopeptide repeat protein [Armatimonadia bacterium]
MSAPSGDPRALCAEAREHLASGKIAEAEQAARQAMAADPQMPQAHVLLGMALTRSGSTSEGIEHLRKAVELDPSSRTARANLAIALERGGQERDALPLWRELADDDPSDKRATEAAKRLATRLGEPAPAAPPQAWDPLQDSGPVPPPP